MFVALYVCFLPGIRLFLVMNAGVSVRLLDLLFSICDYVLFCRPVFYGTVIPYVITDCFIGQPLLLISASFLVLVTMLVCLWDC